MIWDFSNLTTYRTHSYQRNASGWKLRSQLHNSPSAHLTSHVNSHMIIPNSDLLSLLRFDYNICASCLSTHFEYGFHLCKLIAANRLHKYQKKRTNKERYKIHRKVNYKTVNKRQVN